MILGIRCTNLITKAMTDTPLPPLAPEELATQLADLILRGGHPGMALNLDDQDYQTLYQLGSRLYQQARYLDAVKAFGYLCMLKPLERDFESALASSLQMANNYKAAIRHYANVSAMDMRDPIPTFHICECMLALGMTDEVQEGLALVIDECKSTEQQPLRLRAQAMLDILKSAAKQQPPA